MMIDDIGAPPEGESVDEGCCCWLGKQRVWACFLAAVMMVGCLEAVELEDY
jgi:hypothetical protein